MPDTAMMQSFLEDDLWYALRWLFVSAVTWDAMGQKPEFCTANQDAISMLAGLTQARALYEFFFAKTSGKAPTKGDNAHVSHFASSWVLPTSRLYATYMGDRTPVNKRVSHLVYGRSAYSGGSAPDESDHLKSQVLNFAKELRGLTEQFVHHADPRFSPAVRDALNEALVEAEKTADYYGLPNPL